MLIDTYRHIYVYKHISYDYMAPVDLSLFPGLWSQADIHRPYGKVGNPYERLR